MVSDRQFLTVDGVKTRYIVTGEGPAVVLVHGLGASLAAWHENIAPFSRRFRVYALDMPGQGFSENGHGLHDHPSNLAQFLVRFMDAVGIRTASLVGNSGGGFVAGVCALEHPERVEKLVMADTPAFGRQIAPFLRIASLPLVGEVLHLRTLPNVRVLARELFYSECTIDDATGRELLEVRNSRKLRSTSVRAIRKFASFAGVRRSMILLNRLRAFEKPVLIVWGANDRVAPVCHAQAAAAALPNARVHVIPECGHWPQMEKPEEFNRVVMEFLSAPSEAGREPR